MPGQRHRCILLSAALAGASNHGGSISTAGVRDNSSSFTADYLNEGDGKLYVTVKRGNKLRDVTNAVECKSPFVNLKMMPGAVSRKTPVSLEGGSDITWDSKLVLPFYSWAADTGRLPPMLEIETLNKGLFSNESIGFATLQRLNFYESHAGEMIEKVS